ncbi:heme ABC transporter ATP-binding protein [Georgenia sp. MJ173]|uniref:heme ABC transporter ATP-binding protein n=1 Tax=Georgenia sunbinii TaxID=3117728 RepID=UPI002F2636F5
MAPSMLRLPHRSTELPARIAPGEVALAAEGVSARLGGALVLDDVSVEVRAGEVLALVGPNGAGKSTLLGVLAGDREPHTGAVQLAGRPLSRWSATEAAMRRAVLLQSVTLSFPFTVAQVVAMGRAPWARTSREDEDDAVIARAMALTDTVGFAERVFGTLSGGEKARVALARVLAQDTQAVLLDEPTAALDLHHQELVLGLARHRAQEGDAVVVVLHDLNLAAAYADRVAVLDRGRLASIGAPAAVLQTGLLSRVYRHAVEVLPHPRTGAPIILAER